MLPSGFRAAGIGGRPGSRFLSGPGISAHVLPGPFFWPNIVVHTNATTTPSGRPSPPTVLTVVEGSRGGHDRGDDVRTMNGADLTPVLPRRSLSACARTDVRAALLDAVVGLQPRQAEQFSKLFNLAARSVQHLRDATMRKAFDLAAR